MNTVYRNVVIIVVCAAIVVVAGTIFFTYASRSDAPMIMRMRTLLRLPAIKVDGENITIDTVERNTASIKQFYENQDFAAMGIRVDFSTEDGQKRLMVQQRQMLNKMVEDVAIAHMAKQWDIALTDDAVRAAVERPMEEMGSREQVVERLQRLYGWTIDDFERKVVRPQLLRDRVMERYNADNVVTEEMRDKIARAKKELDDGRPFDDVARRYSDGSTAAEGGIMGWFAGGQIQDEIGKKVFAMKKGEYTDVIETPLGLHIVRVNDNVMENGVQLVHISQVIVKKKTFGTFLEEYLRTIPVHLYMPGYAWDQEKALVVFSDPTMVEFEEKIRTDAVDMMHNLLQHHDDAAADDHRVTSDAQQK